MNLKTNYLSELQSDLTLDIQAVYQDLSDWHDISARSEKAFMAQINKICDLKMQEAFDLGKHTEQENTKWIANIKFEANAEEDYYICLAISENNKETI